MIEKISNSTEEKLPTEDECKRVIDLHSKLIADYCPNQSCNDEPEKGRIFVQELKKFHKQHPEYILCIPIDNLQ